MDCPKCHHPIPDALVKAAAAALAGAAGTGRAKARSSESARAAARKRWALHRKRQGIPTPPTT